MKYKKLYTLDWGKNTATMYDGNEDEVVREKMSRDDVQNFPFECEEGSLVIGERAHFGCPRKKYSKAQPFFEEELLELYKSFESRDIIFKLFPEQLLPKAAYYAFPPTKDKDGKNTYEKGDDKDPISIYKYYMANKNMPLMNPPKNFEQDVRREIGEEFKQETNNILNSIRNETIDGEKGYCHDDDLNAKWFNENKEKIYHLLCEETRKAFSLELSAKGDRLLQSYNKTAIFTILAFLRDPYSGEMRKVRTKLPNGEVCEIPPSWRFIKKYVCAESPHHKNGGVARSNVYCHGFPSYVRSSLSEVEKVLPHNLNFKVEGTLSDKHPGLFSQEEKKFFTTCRKKYKYARKEFFNTLKEMLLKE